MRPLLISAPITPTIDAVLLCTTPATRVGACIAVIWKVGRTSLDTSKDILLKGYNSLSSVGNAPDCQSIKIHSRSHNSHNLKSPQTNNIKHNIKDMKPPEYHFILSPYIVCSLNIFPEMKTFILYFINIALLSTAS